MMLHPLIDFVFGQQNKEYLNLYAAYRQKKKSKSSKQDRDDPLQELTDDELATQSFEIEALYREQGDSNAKQDDQAAAEPVRSAPASIKHKPNYAKLNQAILAYVKVKPVAVRRKAPILFRPSGNDEDELLATLCLLDD